MTFKGIWSTALPSKIENEATITEDEILSLDLKYYSTAGALLNELKSVDEYSYIFFPSSPSATSSDPDFKIFYHPQSSGLNITEIILKQE